MAAPARDEREERRRAAVDVALGLLAELSSAAAAAETPRDEPREYSLIFRLARRLQREFSPDASDLEVYYDAVNAFGRAVVETRLVHGHYDWEDLDARWLDFLDIWPKVRFAEDRGPLELAFDRATQRPQVVHPNLTPSFVLFVSTAHELQRIAGDDPILLPVERVGRLFGKDKMYGSRLVSLALEHGFLEVIDPTYSPRAGSARTFRFVHARLDASRA